MDIKAKIEEVISQSIEDIQKSLKSCQQALADLKKEDARNLTYTIELRSLWERDGEKNTTLTYQGTLENAILNSEENFMRVNNRKDVQAEYRVFILLGSASVPVPEECWRPYTKRERTS
jgi:hypothetical protein